MHYPVTYQCCVLAVLLANRTTCILLTAYERKARAEQKTQKK